MKQDVWELRLQTTTEDIPIMDLPMVKRGTFLQVDGYAIAEGYKWKSMAGHMMGGYFVHPNGNVLHPVYRP